MEGMGCPPVQGDTGGCTGYELAASLDFGTWDSDHPYWNEGKGWLPIGDPDNADATRRPTAGCSTATGIPSPTCTSTVAAEHDAGGAVRRHPLRRGGARPGAAGRLSHRRRHDRCAGRDQPGHCAPRLVNGQRDGKRRKHRRPGRLQPPRRSDRRQLVVGDGVRAATTRAASWGTTSAASCGTATPAARSAPPAATTSAVWWASNEGGTIERSYATGSVSGQDRLGGLVGHNTGSVTDSYASGSVSGTGDDRGGLVGWNEGGSVLRSYAVGLVSGTGDSVNGLIGFNEDGTVTASYWDTQKSGHASGGSGTGKTTAELQARPATPASTPHGARTRGTSARRRSTRR